VRSNKERKEENRLKNIVFRRKRKLGKRERWYAER